ncbi:MAG: hypothetical protein JRK53_25660, partial [Deltaproteobacteria bacterium]|nr:hypothetical protein [Deltaproteobacteria bacterium]
MGKKKRKKSGASKPPAGRVGGKDSSVNHMAKPLRRSLFAKPGHLFAAIFAAYLVLTLTFGCLGYLERPDNRIKPVDSVYYFAFLRSGFMDGDFDFHNELERFYPKGNNTLTPRGLPANQFSIGPAIFWAPFYALAHGLTLLLQMFGVPLKADGYSSLYQLFVYIGNSLYGLAGGFLSALILRMYVGRMATFLACLGILLASQLTYYFWSFTVTSHNVSFFSTALFLYLFLKSGLTGRTAVAAGLMVITRWQNAIFLIPLAVHFVMYFPKPTGTEDVKRRSYLKKHIVFIGAMFIAALPQPLAWWYLYGEPFLIPQGAGYLDITNIHIGSVLFSLRHGLLTWHPLLLIGLAGLFLLWPRDRSLCLSLLAVMLLQIILNAAVSDWWGGWSFGNRRFMNLLPLFTLGIGLILDRLKKAALIAGALLILILGIWNQLFIHQYMHGLITRSETISFRQLVTDKFRLPALMRIKAGNEKAVQFLNRRQKGGLSTFKIHAAKTFSLDPTHINSNLVYGLACLLTDDSTEGIRVFRNWHELDPRDYLPKWAL